MSWLTLTSGEDHIFNIIDRKNDSTCGLSLQFPCFELAISTSIPIQTPLNLDRGVLSPLQGQLSQQMIFPNTSTG